MSYRNLSRNTGKLFFDHYINNAKSLETKLREHVSVALKSESVEYFHMSYK